MTLTTVSVEGGNITLTGNCTVSDPLQWCAFGLNTGGSLLMFPAETFFLQSVGGVVVSCSCYELLQNTTLFYPNIRYIAVS